MAMMLEIACTGLGTVTPSAFVTGTCRILTLFGYGAVVRPETLGLQATNW